MSCRQWQRMEWFSSYTTEQRKEMQYFQARNAFRAPVAGAPSYTDSIKKISESQNPNHDYVIRNPKIWIQYQSDSRCEYPNLIPGKRILESQFCDLDSFSKMGNRRWWWTPPETLENYTSQRIFSIILILPFPNHEPLPIQVYLTRWRIFSIILILLFPYPWTSYHSRSAICDCDSMIIPDSFGTLYDFSKLYQGCNYGRVLGVKIFPVGRGNSLLSFKFAEN